MAPESLITLAVAIFLFAASPGPGIFAVVARALASGFWPAVALSVGLTAGDLIWLVAAASGLSVIAQSMGGFFVLLKMAGGLYLAWLGVRTWRARPRPVTTVVDDDPARKGPIAGFLGGVAVTLSNPKAILFYMAVLPTLFDVGSVDTAGLLTAGAVVAAVLMTVCGGYAFVAARARAVFQSEPAMRRLNRISGGLLVGAGVAVATR